VAALPKVFHHQTVKVDFKELNLIEPVLRALSQEGYERPTPIQEQAIPAVLEHRDLLGCAQTGTGKTAAFTVPILQIMHAETDTSDAKRPIRTLILTPTRELAIQIDESIRAYGRHLKLKSLVIFGGVSQSPQVDGLRRGVDILVATPGRLLDLMGQGFISLSQIKWFVLDEADRMLDMGFIHDVKRVIAQLPAKRQTLFFSATMPPEIQSLASVLLHDPVRVQVTPVSSTAETVTQALYHVDKRNKPRLLLHLLNDAAIQSLLVFSRTKHGANRIAKDLVKAGVSAEAIHGNKSQNARQQALQNFKNRKTRVLVATDIAARGIDIDDLSHVANFDLPNVPETYVHRIGRTGRAGASGKAFSFCDAEEREFLRDIQKLIGLRIPVVEDHPFPVGSAVPESQPETQERRPSGPSRQQGRNPMRSGNNERRPNPQGGGRNQPSSRNDRNPAERNDRQQGRPTQTTGRGNEPRKPSSGPRPEGERSGRHQGMAEAGRGQARPSGSRPNEPRRESRPAPVRQEPRENAKPVNDAPPKTGGESSIQAKPVFDDLDRW
jgi:ATP-dependent RNA helicase RhlE